jgi:hypothetical protein
MKHVPNFVLLLESEILFIPIQNIRRVMQYSFLSSAKHNWNVSTEHSKTSKYKYHGNPFSGIMLLHTDT